jgi:hypothetical protein
VLREVELLMNQYVVAFLIVGVKFHFWEMGYEAKRMGNVRMGMVSKKGEEVIENSRMVI